MTQQKFWNDKPSEPIKDSRNQFAAKSWMLMREFRPKRIMDIGCGRSRDPVYFARKGLDVTATDISDNRINAVRDYASKKHVDNIRFIVEDTRNLEIQEGYYDVVYSHLALQYFDRRTMSRILLKIYNGLRRGGLLFLKCKSIDDPEFGVGRKIDDRTFDIKGHIRSFFDEDYMKQLLTKFDIVKMRRTCSRYIGHTGKSRYIEVVARRN